ncbi:coat protein [Sidastrum golden leaf spot virus]|uniref:Capsid protein n=1 Tax=Sidastrum golden leaf spot virus TaxID=858513 RepID=E2GI60_9GEMI|nr:coat protein [Sidastrum golden leaf spot virus]ADK55008.2 coat protein [Sidastrum golden leaf spot virus]
MIYLKMPKRDPSWRSMAGTSKVSRSSNFSPRGGPKVNKASEWVNRPMYRKPRIYRTLRTPDVPRGCEGPCKVQSYEQRNDISHAGKVICISDVTRGSGITHRVGKRFCVKSVYILGKIWMDENIKLKNHTNSVMFWLVRDRRPNGTSPWTLVICSTCSTMSLVLQLLRMISEIVIRFNTDSMPRSLVVNMPAMSRPWSGGFGRSILMSCITTRKLLDTRTIRRMPSVVHGHVLMPLIPCMQLFKIRIYFYDSISI